MIKGNAPLCRASLLLAAVLILPLAASPAAALTSKECSTKYQAAKTAGTLGGKSWNDFRKAECGTDDKPAVAEKAVTKDTKPKTPNISSGGAVFPSTVASKYSSETPAKQRFHTCRDQYNTNKAAGGNGSLKWIQKGGGYYSQCNARLKG